MAAAGAVRPIRFGAFAFDRSSRELRKGGTWLRVPEQSLAILAMLLDRPGEVVTREEIQARLWPHGTIVEFEHSVNSAVKRLREALSDTAATPRYIETLPRKGYRFIGQLETDTPEAGALVPGAVVSHYRIVAEAGRGAMGVVYKAEDLTLGRTVALKFLPEELAAHPPALERMRREARMIGALNHPGICTVHELGEANGRVFLAMEFLDGESLRARMARGPVSEAEFFDIAMQVARALEAAHRQGIVHRDIKPDNLFVTRSGQAKVMDFGLARPVPAGPDGTALTHPGVILGTPAYMAPEQIRGEAVDHRADLFSFGAVLYEMATGRMAFSGNSTGLILDAILNRAPTSRVELNPDLPAKLEEIINKALEKDRGLRYQHASDLQRLKRDTGTKAVARAGARPGLTGVRRRWAAIALSVLALIAAALIVALNVASLRDRVLTAVGVRGAGSLPKIGSLAVLPLENLSGDPQQEYFADGMTDALIAELGQIGSLRVISRTSVMQYKGAKKPLPQIARELNVDAVIEGSVFRAGDRVRITAQLIGVRPERHLWARNYERDLRDALSLQGEIARNIADEVKANVTPDVQARLTSVRPVNPKAHEAYLKGQFFLNKGTEEDVQRAIEYAQQAVQIDPGYAPAYGLLAESTYWSSKNAFGHLSDVEAAGKVKVAAMQALAIDDTLALPHIALGAVLNYDEWDWAGSEREIRRAIALNPNSGLAHVEYAWWLVEMGRQAESLREAKRAIELDPFSEATNNTLAAMYYYGRQYDQALEQARKYVEVLPNHPGSYRRLTEILEANGMYDQEVAAWQKTMTLSGAKAEHVAALGRAYKVGGIRGVWRWDIERLERLPRDELTAIEFANHYAALGEKDKALAWLEKGYQEHVPFMALIKANPVYDSLRSDPRFQDLLRRMKFPN